MNQFNRPTSATSAGSAASDLVSSAQDKFSETVEQPQALAQEQYDELEAIIWRNPLQAAAIAAASALSSPCAQITGEGRLIGNWASEPGTDR